MSEADLDNAEAKLAVKLPMAYRLLLRLHNGQSLQSAGTCSSLEAELFRGELPEAASGPPSAGLFGGCVLVPLLSSSLFSLSLFPSYFPCFWVLWGGRGGACYHGGNLLYINSSVPRKDSHTVILPAWAWPSDNRLTTADLAGCILHPMSQGLAYGARP